MISTPPDDLQEQSAPPEEETYRTFGEGSRGSQGFATLHLCGDGPFEVRNCGGGYLIRNKGTYQEIVLSASPTMLAVLEHVVAGMQAHLLASATGKAGGQ